MSATEAAATAQDIVSVNGTSNDLIGAWASLGRGHCQRDLLHWSQSFGIDVEPVIARVTRRNLKDNTSHKQDHAVLYPHEIIHAIFTRKPDQFKKSFVGVDGDAGLVEFWSKQSGAHWVQSHPGFVDHGIKPECAIPLGFHSGQRSPHKEKQHFDNGLEQCDDIREHGKGKSLIYHLARRLSDTDRFG